MRSSRTLALLAVLVVAVGCGSREGLGGADEGGCDRCPNGYVCVSGTCLRLGTPVRSWWFEVSPPRTSDATLTAVSAGEFAHLPGMPLDLAAKGRTNVTITFRRSALATNAVATGKLVVSARPLIGGQPDLVAERRISDPTAPHIIAVPTDAVGQPAVIQIVPLPPNDGDYPPLSFPIPALTTSHELTMPPTVILRGRLLKSFDEPPEGYVARAYQRGRRISNIAKLDEEGRFRLFLPEGPAYAEVTVRVDPLDPTDGPSFVSRPLDPQTFPLGDMGQISIPAFHKPLHFRLPVNTEKESFVPGAVVRATTIVDMTEQGTFEYSREAVTDSAGRAPLALSPTSANRDGRYEITVIPPRGSAAATHCETIFVDEKGSELEREATVLRPLTVANRLRLHGEVTNTAAEPVARVAIRAIRRATIGTCDGSRLIFTDTSEENGGYEVFVDVGTYDIELEPPGGSIVTRRTMNDLSFQQDDELNVELLRGDVIEGRVADAAQRPIAGATVRVFSEVCSGEESCFGPDRRPPNLHAQGLTDESGHYRLVVPPPLPAASTSVLSSPR
jgi:hypothetical protein